MTVTLVTLILIALEGGCGEHIPGLPWHAYCWADTTATPRLNDWPVMSRDCLSGPGTSAPHGCLRRFDFDDDGDVDLADFAVMQAAPG